MTSKEIGRMLKITPLTVRKHRRNIFSAVKVHSIAQLAALCAIMDVDHTPSE